MFLLFRLCLCLMCLGLLLPVSLGLGSADNGLQFDWRIVVEKSGRADVTEIISNSGQESLIVYVPKTCQNLQIIPSLNYTLLPFSDTSFDGIQIEFGSIDQANLSYVWPDAAVQYDGKFYFAGQEKPNVDKCNIEIVLPDNSFVSWIEGYESFLGNITKKLTFTNTSLQVMPSFAYTFPNMPQTVMESKASKHVNLTFYSIMDGKPWIDKTLEILESQWDWMKNILDGTIDRVNITLAPYGYRNLGTKMSGFCEYYTRNIEIVATDQFGVGLAGWSTALLFHEVTHALTPLLEGFPSFYSEAIAQDFSYDVLRRTELNASADQCEENWFINGYECGVQGGLLHSIYSWKWGNEIYDNATISNACYGTVTFIGDYFAHRWSYDYYHKLLGVFNSTEIASLPDAQKLQKFFEYMGMACGCNITQVMDTIPYLITRWYDAYNLRNEFQNYKLVLLGPFTQAAQETVDAMIKNATEDYETRDFESAISGFDQVQEYVYNLQNQDASYWREQTTLWQNIASIGVILLAASIVIVVLHYRRKIHAMQKQYQS